MDRFFSEEVATGLFRMKLGMSVVWDGPSFELTWVAPPAGPLLQPEHAQGMCYGYPAGLRIAYFSKDKQTLMNLEFDLCIDLEKET